MSKQKFFSRLFTATTSQISRPLWQSARTSNSFKMSTLGRMAKIGTAATLTGGILLYGWDQYEQHINRQLFDATKPKGNTTLKITTSLNANELDDYEYNENQSLTEHFGPGTKVKIGGGRKEGFRGIIPLPAFLEPSNEVRTTELDKSDICHVGIVVQGENEINTRPLIIGRQSPLGPLPTLMSAIGAGWKQFVNPVEGETVGSVMELALKTTVANEAPHIATGTSFDTTVIEDLAIPVEFVDEAVLAAEKELNPVMTFAWDNCMTTKSYTLLKLAEKVDDWANSNQADAPPREQADAFIVGCYNIIETDIHTRGYGVLNNNKITTEMKRLGEITSRMSKEPKQESEFNHNQRYF